MNPVPDEPGMVKEEITLPDGRYLIYYTFVDDDAEGRGSGDGPSTA
jgi:hypothetical protein